MDIYNQTSLRLFIISFIFDSVSRALRTSRDKIPVTRVTELEETIKTFYGVSIITEELLKQAQDIDYRFVICSVSILFYPITL